MRRRGSQDSGRSRRRTITAGVNATDSTGGEIRTADMVVMAGRVDTPGMLEMATRDRSMRRERLTPSQQGLALFCRVRIYRDTRKISSV